MSTVEQDFTEQKAERSTNMAGQATNEVGSVGEGEGSLVDSVSGDELSTDLQEYYKTIISPAVNEILRRLRKMYEGCYNGVSVPVGIILPNGVYRIKKENWEIGRYPSAAIKIISRDLNNAFKYAYGKEMSKQGQESAERDIKLKRKAFPRYKALVDAGPDTYIFYWLHIRMIFGNLEYCKDIKDTSSGVVDGRVVTYDVMEKWAKDYLTELIHKHLVENKINDMDSEDKVQEIVEVVQRACTSVAVILEGIEKDNSVPEVLAMFGHNGPPAKGFIDVMRQQLKLEGEPNKTLDVVGSEASFTKFRYVEDKEKAEAGNLMAGSVLDGVIESGQIPRWDNVLFGKLANGQLLFWKDFMKDTIEDRIIYIYGGSGSGKGIMTSSLLTSAMASKLSIFYMDGKPESGAGFGRIAWREGLEAAVFNHIHAGGGANFGESHLESLTWGKRTVEETLGSGRLVGKVFKSQSMIEKYLAIMRMYRSFELLFALGKNKERLSNQNHKIFVLDEVENFAINEVDIINHMKELVNSVDSKNKALNNDVKGKLFCMDAKVSLDAVGDVSEEVKFAIQWFNYRRYLRVALTEFKTIALRLTKVSVIFIFQSSNMPLNFKNDFSFMRYAVDFLSFATKLIGKNTLSDGYTKLGASASMNSSWYAKVKSGSGWWGITKNSKVDSAVEGQAASDVAIFKSFCTFVADRGTQHDAMDGGKPFRNGNSSYIEGYLDKLFNAIYKDGTTPGQVLQSGFDDFNEVAEVDKGLDLKAFIYDAHTFAAESSGDSGAYEEVLQVAQEEDAQVANVLGQGDVLEEDFSDQGDAVGQDSVMTDDGDESIIPEAIQEEFVSQESVSPESVSPEFSSRVEVDIDIPNFEDVDSGVGGYQEPVEEPRTTAPVNTYQTPVRPPVRKAPIPPYEPEQVIAEGDEAAFLDEQHAEHEARGTTNVQQIPKGKEMYRNFLSDFAERAGMDYSFETARVVLERQSQIVLDMLRENLEEARSLTLLGNNIKIGTEPQFVDSLVNGLRGGDLSDILDVVDLLKYAQNLASITMDRTWEASFIDAFNLNHIAELFKRIETLKRLNVNGKLITLRDVEEVLTVERASSKKRKEVRHVYDKSLFERTSKAWKASTNSKKIACARMARRSMDFTKSRKSLPGKILAGVTTGLATGIFGIFNLGFHAVRTGRNLRRNEE